MTTEYPWLVALIAGFSGSYHCIYMCGSIMGSLNSLNREATLKKNLHINLIYSFGRILSYSICGALVASLSLGISKITNTEIFLAFIRIVAGTTMAILAYYLINPNSNIIFKLDMFGKKIWQMLQPLAHKFTINKSKKTKSKTTAMLAGMVWGWLPCGLVYSMLPLAISTANTAQGALVMFCFGLGTLPALITFGATYQKMYYSLKNKKFRIIASVLMLYLSYHSYQTAFKQLQIIG